MHSCGFCFRLHPYIFWRIAPISAMRAAFDCTHIRRQHPFMAQAFPLQRIYDRNELIADGIVHGVAIAAAIVGAGLLLFLVSHGGAAQAAAHGLYVVALLAMLGCSMAYNLTPVSPLKWLLRRFDHSAIYLMIAGTYTPLLMQLQNMAQAIGLAVTVWAGAVIGIVMKVRFPGRYDGLAVAVYLALGWVGIFAAPSFIAVLPKLTIVLIFVGGLLYSAGVPFYLWEKLRFQNAIWHMFVAAAAACHFVAIALLYV
jgi:hemolysin III